MRSEVNGRRSLSGSISPARIAGGLSALYAWGTWGIASWDSPGIPMFRSRQIMLEDSDWSARTCDRHKRTPIGPRKNPKMADQETETVRFILINYTIVPFDYVLIPFCTNVYMQSCIMLEEMKYFCNVTPRRVSKRVCLCVWGGCVCACVRACV